MIESFWYTIGVDIACSPTCYRTWEASWGAAFLPTRMNVGDDRMTSMDGVGRWSTHTYSCTNTGIREGTEEAHRFLWSRTIASRTRFSDIWCSVLRNFSCQGYGETSDLIFEWMQTMCLDIRFKVKVPSTGEWNRVISLLFQVFMNCIKFRLPSRYCRSTSSGGHMISKS